MKTFVQVGATFLDPLEVLAFWPYNRREVAVALRGHDCNLIIPGATVADMKDAMSNALEVLADA